MKLHLKRPLVFFDIESTGLMVGADKIVEICMMKVMPDGSSTTKTMRINPEMHIPEQVSEVHGIYDKDVADEPTFKEVADEICEFISGCDLAGYNLQKFDVPLLMEEFLRADINFDLRGIYLVDVQNIFHRMEQRTLKAAYKFYCGVPLENAHSAEADTIATYKVLQAQLEKYENTPFLDENDVETFPIKNDVAALSAFSTSDRNVDYAGHIVFDKNDVEVFNFGKYKGVSVEAVFAKEPSYYDWMMKSDFPLYTKKIIGNIRVRMLSNRLNTR